MIWAGFLFWRIVWAMLGAFGTAYIHERQGRDVTAGGLIGLVVGFIGGVILVIIFWVILYYTRDFLPRGQWNGSKRWYNWWG
jgi:uncharacterized membrane protein YeaQ/YmgE (transglycosylase-associated protein family)